MSYLGNFLQTHIEKSGKTSREISALLSLDPSQLSGFVSGRRPSCNIETLGKMVSGISEDASVRAGLLEAYFKDQVPDSEMKSWVSVAPPFHTIEDPPNYGLDEVEQLAQMLRRLALPTSIIRAMMKITEAMPDHDALRDLVLDLGEFTEEALTPKINARATSAPKAGGRKPKR